jgi:hypothetical protein
MKRLRLHYKKALYIAAEEAYEKEILDTAMKELLIGEDKDFLDKEDWVTCRISEWLEAAEEENARRKNTSTLL